MWRYGWISIRRWRTNQFCWLHGWSCRGFSCEWLEKLVKEDWGHGWVTPSVFYFPFGRLESNKTTRVPRNQVPPSDFMHIKVKWKTCWAPAAHTLHGRMLNTWWGWRPKNVQSPWMSFIILLMSMILVRRCLFIFKCWFLFLSIDKYMVFKLSRGVKVRKVLALKALEVGFWKTALCSLVLTVAWGRLPVEGLNTLLQYLRLKIPKTLNDFRPAALTSPGIKASEKLAKGALLDSLQGKSQLLGGVDEATKSSW